MTVTQKEIARTSEGAYLLSTTAGTLATTKADVGLGNVDNTSDASKSIGGNAATATTASACSGNSATATTATTCSGNSATATTLQNARTFNGASFDGSANIIVPSGSKILVNGKIAPSVASSNLTIAIKTIAGADPSAGDPVKVQMNGTTYAITAALSLVMNAGTNWAAAGSAYIGTNEVDWFVYLAYCTASSTMRVYYSRIPWALKYGDFGSYNTEKGYVGDGTSMVAGDPVCLIGRVASTLSLSGTGYLWTLPTADPETLVQSPIFETRALAWTTDYTSDGTMTWDGSAADVRTYMIRGRSIVYNLKVLGTIATHADSELRIRQPITCAKDQYATALVQNGGGARTGGWVRVYTDGTLRTTYAGAYGYSGGWTLGASGGIAGTGNVEFAL